DFLCKPVDREQLIARVRSLLRQKAFTDELERAEAVLFTLARSIEEKDPYTEGHCARLAEYSARLGEHIGLSAPEIKALRRAGVVHDIGKVAVPDTILLKPARLTRTEQLILWRHPVIGERICFPLKSFQMVLPIIRHHHEKMNGTGYPDCLQGEDIPITARVLTIVDVYDALTTERPYKEALGEDQALAVMKKEVKKGWWDPRLFDAFHEMMQIKLPDNLAAQAEAGADVAITFRNSARQAQHTVTDVSSFGVRAVALYCDVSDPKNVKSALKEAVKELGGIDVLVNNAANYETAEFEKLTLAQWDAMFASNTRGPFLVSQKALHTLRERKGR